MMMNVVLENLINILSAALITLIGVLGSWITLKLANKIELANINEAQQEVIRMAQITVEELQQTLVAELKAASQDGKLSKSEITMLGEKLVCRTIEKMAKPSYDLLDGAGVDIVALIHGAGEAWINLLKQKD